VKKKPARLTRVEKNPGHLRGWLVVTGDSQVGWRRLKKEAEKLADMYEEGPEAWRRRQELDGLTRFDPSSGQELSLLAPGTP
jgi:hypothetical protein